MTLYNQIPEKMLISIDNYVNKGAKLGHFLSAIFANDLLGAVMRADKANLQLIPTYVLYVYHQTPSNCNGSYAIIDKYYEFFNKKREIYE